MFDDERDENPADEAIEPTAGQPPGSHATPDADQSAAEPDAPTFEREAAADDGEDAVEPAPADEAAAADAAAEEAPSADEEIATEEVPSAESAARERSPGREGEKSGKDAIPGADLEPDLVLDEGSERPSGYGERAGAEIQAAEESFAGDAPPEDGEVEEVEAPAATPTPVLQLAADARYQATGKRKRAVARVIIKPGTGSYVVNGRELQEFFPRPTLQRTARGPLETVGQQERMDVVARIHGGGVSSQAGALRHGIARALVEADPNLRGELKRRGFLTRDSRVKERKKAGLKKARKRPQFSKR